MVALVSNCSRVERDREKINGSFPFCVNDL